MVADCDNIKCSTGIINDFKKIHHAYRKDRTRKISQIEGYLPGHDEQINAIIKTIKQLIQPAPVPKKRCIGFDTDEH